MKQVNKYFKIVCLVLLVLFLLVGCVKQAEQEEQNKDLILVRAGSSPDDCCYPSDCPQAKDNPKDCTCIYAVACLSDGEVKDILYRGARQVTRGSINLENIVK